MKLPAELLTPGEVRALLQVFGPSTSDERNLAMVLLMYRAGLKIGEVVLARAPALRAGCRLACRSGNRYCAGALDSPGQRDPGGSGPLMEVRRALGVRVTAPLFCTIMTGAKGNRLYTSYMRETLKEKAREAGIDRRTTCEGLRQSGIEHRARSHGRVAAHLVAYIDDELFQARYPDAFEKWESAVDLFAVNALRHQSRIGHDCRDAMLTFVDFALKRHRVALPESGGL